MNLKELHYSIADTGCRLPYSYDPSQPFEPQRARAEKKFLELLGMPEKKGEVGVKVEFVNDSESGVRKVAGRTSAGNDLHPGTFDRDAHLDRAR